jgi:cobalt-zinc-cadmium efflux system outer membrane protein
MTGRFAASRRVVVFTSHWLFTVFVEAQGLSVARAQIAPPAAPSVAPATGASGEGAIAVVPSYSLDQLLAITRRDSLVLQSARAQALGARAGVTTAGAYPNPEVEISGASLRARQSGALSGSGTTYSFSQRIEAPGLRELRVVAATAGAQAAEIGVWIVENNLLAEVKLRFFEALRRDEELDVAGEELALTEQIRDRIRVRTRTGEGARFDLIRADNEVAIAARQVAIAKARIFESRALLRLAVGASLGETFKLAGDFYRSTPRADYAGLRDAVVASNPELKRAMAELARSEKLVDVERQQVLPGLSVRISQENEPDLRTTRGGVALSVPMWDRRRGPIDEARAQVIRSRSDSDLRRFSLVQEFDAAWQRYQGVLGSVQALESGILREARTVVDIAEAAYRFGERGILEYLDARRQFRGIRVELISARYELYAALTELERLAARDVKGE